MTRWLRWALGLSLAMLPALISQPADATLIQVASRAVQQLNDVLNEPVVLDERQFHRHYEIQRVLPFPVVQNLNSMQIAKFEERPFNASGVDLEMQPTAQRRWNSFFPPANTAWPLRTCAETCAFHQVRSGLVQNQRPMLPVADLRVQDAAAPRHHPRR